MMASLLVSIFLVVSAFETAQPLAHSMWAIAPAYQYNHSKLISGVMYANPFGYADLYNTNSFVNYTLDGYCAGIQWQYFGIPEYREDTVSAGAGCAIAQWISTGVELHNYIVSIKTQQLRYTQSFYDYGIYCTIKPLDRASLFVMQNNVRNFNDDGYIPSETIVALRMELFKGCIVEYEFRYSDYLTQLFKVQGHIARYCAVNVAYSRELNTSSAGISIIWDSLLLQYILHHHSFLGNTHSFGVMYSLAGFKYTTLDKPLKKEIQKLDIQSCTAEELMELNVVPEVLCQRIVKYRSMFGPVSVTSLYQLGFTTQQIRDLKEYTYNFYEQEKRVHDNDEHNNKVVHNTYISSEEKNRKIKQLFQSMVTAEIPAYIALSLAEEFQKNGQKGLLQSSIFKSLTEQQQKAVKKACGMQ